jgi:hypothetical protein
VVPAWASVESWLVGAPYRVVRVVASTKDSAKPREAHAYLQYIVDNYDAIPPSVVFAHSRRVSWQRPGREVSGDCSP